MKPDSNNDYLFFFVGITNDKIILSKVGIQHARLVCDTNK